MAATLDALIQAVAEANRLSKEAKTNFFVCEKCKQLRLGDPNHLATSKYGDNCTFCEDCTGYCDHCDENFSEEMAYTHERCDEDEE